MVIRIKQELNEMLAHLLVGLAEHPLRELLLELELELGVELGEGDL